MSEEGETDAARLWRDRVAQARLAEATCAVRAAENERLRLENERLTIELARLRAFASPDPKEIEVQIDALRTALLEVLVSSEGFDAGDSKYVDHRDCPSELSVKL
jgi:hypothetical protein